MASRTPRSAGGLISATGPFGAGENVLTTSASRDSRTKRGPVGRVASPPEQIAEVKAVACEPPSEGTPLSRRSTADVHRLTIERGICDASHATIVRWLRDDAIRPWLYRSWIFPTDPDFAEKAGRILDLYAGRFEGRLLRPGEFVICADEKPSIQARRRIAPTAPPAAGVPRGQRVEHTYTRGGALTYLGAWDVRRGMIFGRSEARGGIAPFDRLVRQVMRKEPYASARRVFWIVDNGSSHQGNASIKRLESRWPNLRLIHTPVHASWLNQIEIYFSIVQRKVLTPNDFDSLAAVARRLNEFEDLYNEIAEPFGWEFTRSDMNAWLARIAARQTAQLVAAA
jgi:DDE superfamily endonuclease